jgi:hypothetical protein
MSQSGEFDELNPQQLSRKRLIRIWTAISIVMSISLFSCAGFCLLTTALIGPKISGGDDPEKVVQVAAEMTDLKLPRDFEGKARLVFETPIISMRLARFDQKEGRGLLLLGEVHNKVFVYQDEKKQLEQLIEKESSELKALNVTEQRIEKKVIRNLPAKFTIDTGDDLASTTKLTQVKGYFRGKSDEVILVLQCENGILSDQEIDEFLDSIK